MPGKIGKWGNSLGVRLPQYIAERTGLVAGDHLYIKLMDNGEIVIRPVKARDIPAGYSSGAPAQQAKAVPVSDKEFLSKW